MTSARVAKLRAALESAATALATADLAGLLASEVAIEDALSALLAPVSEPHDDQAAIVAELDRLQAALVRCRRLGAGLKTFARLSSEAQGRPEGYGRGQAYSGHGLIARG